MSHPLSGSNWRTSRSSVRRCASESMGAGSCQLKDSETTCGVHVGGQWCNERWMLSLRYTDFPKWASLVFPPDSRIACFGLPVRQIPTLARACLDRLCLGNVTDNVLVDVLSPVMSPVHNTISYSKTDPLQICMTPTRISHNVIISPVGGW